MYIAIGSLPHSRCGDMPLEVAYNQDSTGHPTPMWCDHPFASRQRTHRNQQHMELAKDPFSPNLGSFSLHGHGSFRQTPQRPRQSAFHLMSAWPDWLLGQWGPKQQRLIERWSHSLLQWQLLGSRDSTNNDESERVWLLNFQVSRITSEVTMWARSRPKQAS